MCLQLTIVAACALCTCWPSSAQEPATLGSSNQLSLMPVPASVKQQAGRLPVTGTFSVATKGYADDRLQNGIARMITRLAGRTVLSLTHDLAVDEAAATLVIECERPGDAVPSINENES